MVWDSVYAFAGMKSAAPIILLPDEQSTLDTRAAMGKEACRTALGHSWDALALKMEIVYEKVFREIEQAK